MSDSTDTVSRAAPEYSITLSFTDLDDLYGELAPFLAHEGMFIPIATPQPVGTKLDFDLVAEAEGVRIAGRGEVVWVVGRLGSHPAGMAVRFDLLAAESPETLATLVKRREEAGEPVFDLHRGEKPSQEAETAPGETDTEPAEAAGATPELERMLEEVRASEEEALALRRSLERELEEAKTSLAELQAELDQERNGPETVTRSELDETRDRVTELEGVHKELERARAEAAAPGEELEAARRRVAELEKELEGARERGDELETAQGRIAELETELEAARGRNAELTGELEATRAEAEGPRQELAETRAGLERVEVELAEAAERVEKLEAELEEAAGRIAELEPEAEKAGQLEAARVASEERVGALEDEVHEATRRRAEAEERLGTLQSDLAAAERARDEALEEARDGAEALTAARAELDEAKSHAAERANLARQLEQEKESTARLQLLVERVRSEHATLQEELVAAQTALAKSQQQKQGLRSQLEELRVIEVSGDELRAGDEAEEAFSQVYESEEVAPPAGLRSRGRLIAVALIAALAGAAAAYLALSLLG